MHKKMFITALAVLLCGIAFGQEQRDRWIWPDEHIEDALFIKIGIGPKIGAGLGLASNPSFFDFNFKGGLAYQLGAAVNFHVAHHPSLKLHGIERVGLEIEALYGQYGFNAGESTLKMKCFEIPILLQLYLTRSFIMEFGVTPAKILNVKPDYLQAGEVVANVGGIKGGNVMISAGACYKTDFGLTIGLRYNYGTSEWAENFHSRTSSVMLSANYLFSIIK